MEGGVKAEELYCYSKLFKVEVKDYFMSQDREIPRCRKVWYTPTEIACMNIPAIVPDEKSVERYNSRGSALVYLPNLNEGFLDLTIFDALSPIGAFWGKGTRTMVGVRRPRIVLASNIFMELYTEQVGDNKRDVALYDWRMFESYMGKEPVLRGIYFNIDPVHDEKISRGTFVRAVFE